ncbi:MAG: helix-turn-helix transcriptional regulator [Leptolyngbya sp. SIOISBB]|nr:helix-turn-helix transcriptional regulator [Leptolyngbya sp. SIOISBB]
MMTSLRSNQDYDWLLPSGPDNPQLLHSDRTDRVLICPPSLGQGYRQEIPLRDDLTLVIIDYTFHQDVIADVVGAGDRIEFEFHLAGPHADYSLCIPCFGLRQLGLRRAGNRVFKVEVFFKRPTLVSYAQDFMERLSPLAHRAAHHILESIYRHQVGGTSPSTAGMIQRVFAAPAASPPAMPTTLTPPPSLEQILTDALYNESTVLGYATRSPLTPAMRQLLEQILSCSYQGAIRRHYLTQKALKLVDLRLNALLQPPFNEAEMYCITQAATLLRTQLTHPPSLAALARQVGTNRLTLTQGFHTLYGTTPFGYLRNCRLHQARRLLMVSELSVAEVAAAVGYTSRSRFATAFRQKVGLNPKAFQMQAWQT